MTGLSIDIDPKRIRKFEFVDINDVEHIQFIATGDKHKMIKEDDGSIHVIKIPEAGKDYKYGKPYTIDDALYVLGLETYPSHKKFIMQIKNYLNL